jgi:excisionase family DNA binding protein
MRKDLQEYPLRREFEISEGAGLYAYETNAFEYYENVLPELRGKVRILLNHRLIEDISDGRTRRYAIREELAEYLEKGPPSGHETAPIRHNMASSDATEARSPEPDLERLIQDKMHLDLPAAARYLNLSVDHVRRLVRMGKLTQIGQGRPMKISRESLRAYKGT